MQDIREMAETLCAKYTWARVSPNQTNDTLNAKFLIACIATSADNETRIFAFLHDLNDPWDINKNELINMLEFHNIKWAGRKADFIVKSMDMLRSKYNGHLPMERDKLEAFPGVGRHIASVILATLGDQHEFAVDYHVRRIFKRLEINPETDTDLAYEKLVREHVAAHKLGHFSRALVDFGQDICAFKPRCHLCAFDCPSRKNTKGEKGISRHAFEYAIVEDKGKSYAVTVRSGKLSCSCKGYRYRKSCKHINAVNGRNVTTGDTITLDEA